MNDERRDARRARIERTFEDEVVPELEAYTRIECLSPAFDPAWREHGALRQAAELLAHFGNRRQGLALSIEIVEFAGRTPLLVGEIAPSDADRSHESTLIYGHLDKQPTLGAWHEGLGPFTPVREGDRLYGRGTADDGYAAFAAFTALETLAAEEAGHGRVVVLIEASEESGSPDLPTYLDALGPRLGEPGLVICLDSGCPTYDRLWTTTSLRGILIATLTVDVLHEGVHSGHAGGIVPSSFLVARQLLARIEDPNTGQILLPELNVPIDAARRRAIEELAAEFGETAAGEFPTVAGLQLLGNSPAARIENGTWQPALEVIGLAGAPAPEDAGNVLRPSTTLKLAIRLPPSCPAGRAGEALKRALTTSPPHGAEVRVRIDQPADGWQSPQPAPWLGEALQRASLAYFGAAPRSIGLGGSIPFMPELGNRYPQTQFVATGVLGPESNAHGPNEFLHLPTAKAITAVVADLLDAPR